MSRRRSVGGWRNGNQDAWFGPGNRLVILPRNQPRKTLIEIITEADQRIQLEKFDAQ